MDGNQFGEPYTEIERAPDVSPFAYRIKVKGKWHVVFPSVIHKSMRKQLTPESSRSYFLASAKIYHIRAKIAIC